MEGYFCTINVFSDIIDRLAGSKEELANHLDETSTKYRIEISAEKMKQHLIQTKNQCQWITAGKSVVPWHHHQWRSVQDQSALQTDTTLKPIIKTRTSVSKQNWSSHTQWVYLFFCKQTSPEFSQWSFKEGSKKWK